MLHIITCNYHGCDQQHFYTDKLPANQVVNIGMMVTFIREGKNKIKFSFNGHDPIVWTFIGEGIREKEYERIFDWINNLGIGDTFKPKNVFSCPANTEEGALAFTHEKMKELMQQAQS